LFQRRRYPNYRTVFSIQKNGFLVIKIGAGSHWGVCAVNLVVTGFWVFFGWVFEAALIRTRPPVEALYVVPVIAFLSLACTLVPLGALESLCSVELAAGEGVFRWSWRIWRWGRDTKVSQHDVTSVVARAKWYGNRLSITMNGKTYSLVRRLVR